VRYCGSYIHVRLLLQMIGVMTELI
jgi:hypothetical protein